MPCSLPRWTGTGACWFSSLPAWAFPDFEAGRHPHHYFRGLLKLHTRYGLQGCSPTLLWALSRGFTLTSYPIRALASYQIQPTTTWMGPSPTGDPRLWGALKKVMRPPCGSTSGGRPVAPCSALCHHGNPPVVQPLEKAEHFPFLDGFSLDGSARRTPLPLSSVKTRRTESTSTSIPLLPIAPIAPRWRSDSDSLPATSVALLPRPSTPR